MSLRVGEIGVGVKPARGEGWGLVEGLRRRSVRCSGGGIEVLRAPLLGRGKIGFDGEEVAECGALGRGEGGGVAWVGVEGVLALLGRKAAEIAEGAGDDAAAIFRKTSQLLHGGADLLALLGGEALHDFGAGEEASPALGRHVVEFSEAIAHALLGLGRQIVEAGFLLEGALLLRRRHVLVSAHPLREVITLGTDVAAGVWVGTLLLEDGLCTQAWAGMGVCCADEWDRGREERCGEEEPGWENAEHHRVEQVMPESVCAVRFRCRVQDREYRVRGSLRQRVKGLADRSVG